MRLVALLPLFSPSFSVMTCLGLAVVHTVRVVIVICFCAFHAVRVFFVGVLTVRTLLRLYVWLSFACTSMFLWVVSVYVQSLRTFTFC